jgi:hypothetical protein
MDARKWGVGEVFASILERREAAAGRGCLEFMTMV